MIIYVYIYVDGIRIQKIFLLIYTVYFLRKETRFLTMDLIKKNNLTLFSKFIYIIFIFYYMHLLLSSSFIIFMLYRLHPYHFPFFSSTYIIFFFYHFIIYHLDFCSIMFILYYNHSLLYLSFRIFKSFVSSSSNSSSYS